MGAPRYIGAGTDDAKFAYDGSITATASGTQATAYPLVAVVNRVTTVATAGDAVRLPPAKAGMVRYVTHAGSANLDVYPSSGDTIDGFAADTAMRVITKTRITYTCSIDGIWHASSTPLPVTKYTANAASGAATAAAGDLSGAQKVIALYSAVGAAALTTRTAAQMYGDMGNIKPGDVYMARIINTSGGTTTLTGGTGVTITGTAGIASNAWNEYMVTVTSASAITFQYIGSGTVS
ncbi:MAG TPA: hypothetical protein VFM10_07025 [Terriglobales bacterium]|nr:hypothetical protein [Terriglobales bacterium]